MLYSTPTPKLYQVRPKKRKRSLAYTEDGWYTTDGYIYEADRLSRCVDWARHHLFPSEFTFFVSINITQDISPQELKTLWPKVTEHLAYKQVVALWVCEVSRRSNRFNFHLLLRSHTPDIKDILKKKFGKLGVTTNIKADAFDAGRRRFTVRYMTKAKTPKYRDGVCLSQDRWKSKRVLLRPEDKIRKYGYVGEFFPDGWNKELIWGEIKKHERRIREGLQHPAADDYAEYLHDLTGGYFTLNRVRRSVGYFGVPDHWVPEVEDELLDFPSVDGDTEEGERVVPAVVHPGFFQEPFVADDFQRGVSPAIGQMLVGREPCSDRGNDAAFDGVVVVPNLDRDFHLQALGVGKNSLHSPTDSRNHNVSCEAPSTPQKAVRSPRPCWACEGHQKRFTGLPEGKDEVRVQEARPPPKLPHPSL